MFPARACVFAAFLSVACVLPGYAQDGETPPAGEGESPKAVPVTIMSGAPDSPYIRMGADLQAVLDGEENLRILPVAGRGAVQTLLDMIDLGTLDAGIVSADALTYAKSLDILEDGDSEKIIYLAKLGSEDVHVVASPKIRSLGDLKGKRVNIGGASSNRYVTGSLLFALLGIEIEATDEDFATALSNIEAGRLDAAVLVSRKPSSAIAALPRGKFNLLAVPVTPVLKQIYAPGFFSSDEYPSLVPPGATVDTISVGVVLAAVNANKGTTHYAHLKALTAALYSSAETLREGRRFHDWTATNLAAEVPGWTRAALADDWLNSASSQAKAAASKTEEAALKVEFQSYLAENGREADAIGENAEALFEQFMKWKREQAQ